MNKNYILIPLSIIVISTLIYFIITFSNYLKKIKLSLESYGNLGIANCATDNDTMCNELNNLDITYDFMSTDSYSKDNIIYIIKLIANFLKYLNSDYNNNKLNINNSYNQKLITSNIDNKPIGISYIYEDKTKVFFIFRGTQTAADLIGDTNYNYYNIDNINNPNEIKIHKFYNSVYQEIKQQLLNCLYNETTDIYICGHSMGAAIGFVMAQDISQNKKYKVNVIGIAPPRAGNKPFVDSIKNNCNYVLAVINMADVIPTVPFSYMGNLIDPYTPVQFAQITPAVIFNNLNVSIGACHQPITYYNGIKNGPLTYTYLA